MGKSNRIKTDKANETLSAPANKRKNASKGMPTWLGTTIVIAVLAALLLTTVFFVLDGRGTFKRMRVILATENYEVTVPMMS